MHQYLLPKSWTVFKEGYSFKIFSQDLMAGVVVGIVALPLSIAFAIASGVKPEQGLITAVIAGFIISLLSGSRVQIGGPTGAFIIIIYGIVKQYGYEGLVIATIMAGIMLVILGIARLGDVIKFIPYPVTVGFTTGIALIIFTTEIKDFFGFTYSFTAEHFMDKWMAYFLSVHTLNIFALFLGLLTIFIIVFWRKVTDRLPGPLIALVVTTCLAQFFHLPVETIGSRFGHVPNSFPAPHLPHVTLEYLISMSQPALAIALLAGIESLLSAVVADGMTGRRHRSNAELVAQGVANIVTPIFGGIPATGAIARTATNVKNGGQTPVAGMIHAVVILLIFLFFGQLAELIPMATLAGMLIVVAFNMSELPMFIGLFKGPKSDVMVLLITFLLTVIIDLTVAIEVGIVLASFLFMKRMIEVTQVNNLNQELEDENVLDPEAVKKEDIPQGVEVFEINGPFFFGAADKFEDTIRQMRTRPKVLVLRLRFVPAIDATGLHALENLLKRAKKDGTQVVFSGVHAQPLKTIRQAGIIDQLGEDHFYWDIKKALAFAGKLVTGNN